MVARVRAAFEPGISPRRPRSRLGAVHPTYRALGSFFWSTGLWLARAQTTGREAKVCRSTSWDWWIRLQIAGARYSQMGCRWRVCATGGALLRCTGAIAGVSSTLSPPRESLHPPPGRRCRCRHALRPPAHSRSSRRQRRIPGPLGRHLPAHPRPCISFRRLRAAPLASLPPISHLASRLYLPPASSGEAPFGERRFKPAGWAAATVAAVAVAASVAAAVAAAIAALPTHPATAAAPCHAPGHLLTPSLAPHR